MSGTILLSQPGGAGTLSSAALTDARIFPGRRCKFSFIGTTTSYTWSGTDPQGNPLVYSTTTPDSPRSPSLSPTSTGAYTFIFTDNLGSQTTMVCYCTSVAQTDTVNDVEAAADLRTCYNVFEGSLGVVRARCRTSGGDGGGGTFRWNPTNDNVAFPDDGGTRFVPTGRAVGCWQRDFTGDNVHAEWFGQLPGDGSTNVQAILQAAVNFCRTQTLGATVIIPYGTHAISSSLTAATLGSGSVVIRGVGLGSVLKATSAMDAMISNGNAGAFEIRDLTLDGNGLASRGPDLSGPNTAPVKLSNLLLKGFTRQHSTSAAAAVCSNSVSDLDIDGCQFSGNGVAETTQTCTVDSTLDTVNTVTAHGRTAGSIVYFTTSGSFPGGIVGTRGYFVIASGLTATAFKMSLTPGGSAYDITVAAGSGTLTLHKPVSSYEIAVNIDSSTLTSRVRVRNCWGVGLHTSYGFVLYDVDDSSVLDSYYYASAEGNLANSGYGIGIYKTGGVTACNRITIRGNRILNTSGIGIYLQGCVDSIVSGNILKNVCQFQNDDTLQAAGIGSDAGPNSIIGNWIDTTGKDAIRFAGKHIVSDNHIINCGKASINGNGAVDGSVIDSNIIANSTNQGIAILDGNGRLTITSNSINVASFGIYLPTGINDSVVANNNIVSCTAQGMVLVSGARNTIAHNTSEANGNAGFEIGSTLSLIQGNQARANTTDGLFLNGCDYSTVKDNILYNNTSLPLHESATGCHKEGNRFSSSGALEGSVALSGGTATVNTIEVRTGDCIQLTRAAPGGGALGHLSYTIVDATSFTILSSSGAEASTILWRIRH